MFLTKVKRYPPGFCHTTLPSDVSSVIVISVPGNLSAKVSIADNWIENAAYAAAWVRKAERSATPINLREAGRCMVG